MTTTMTMMQSLGLRAMLTLPTSFKERLCAKQPGEVLERELTPEARFLLWLGNIAGEPELATLTPEESRRKSEAVTALFGFRGPEVRSVRNLSLTRVGGSDGALPARLYEPRGATEYGPLLVYFHGGGFVDGNLDTIDCVCRLLCAESRARLLSVEYRKAPEHPFPAAVDDARAALAWAHEEARSLGADPSRIGIGGDSSGANLATVACLLARDDGGPLPVYQLLIYPVVDATRKPESFQLFGERFGLTAAKYDWFLDHYATPEQRPDVRISPLLADDLSGLPPTYVLTAGFDILHDEGAAYARRLQESGVKVTYRCCDALFHGFARFYELIPAARAALEDAAVSVRQNLVYRTWTPLAS